MRWSQKFMKQQSKYSPKDLILKIKITKANILTKSMYKLASDKCAHLFFMGDSFKLASHNLEKARRRKKFALTQLITRIFENKREFTPKYAKSEIFEGEIYFCFGQKV